MNLFIDTNIFLSFYHLSSDDLEQLRKLTDLVREKGITLLLPEQVVNEFRRNRANKIADALKHLRDQKLRIQYPQICMEYDEYKKAREYQKGFEEQLEKLLASVERDVAEQNLGADVIINELFAHADKIPMTPQALEAARTRCELGNPPGKSGSLGDAVNWEALLGSAPKSELLFFISDDKDFRSALDDALFDRFLLDEWNTKKQADLRFYKRLSAFLVDYYPNIRLATDMVKDAFIKQLQESSSFMETHSIISELGMYSDFNQLQVNGIVVAFISNDQVHLIINDSDVKSFIKKVIQGRESQIVPGNLKQLKAHLGKTTEDEEEELPF